MDPVTIIALIEAAMKAASVAIQLGEDAYPFAKAIYDQLINGAVVTQSDLDALEAKIDSLSAELQVPLPPE